MEGYYMPRWERPKFTHEFVGKGEEDLREIFLKQVCRYINQQKGYSYLRLK
jgi:hypothetical protein